MDPLKPWLFLAACSLWWSAAAAFAQPVLFSDDFDRGWQNAMTHAHLPPWSGAGAWLPPGGGQPFDVRLDIDGPRVEVWIDDALVAKYDAPALAPGGCGVLSWGQRDGGWGTVLHALSVEDGGGPVLTETWTAPGWRRLLTANAAGVRLNPAHMRENLRWDFVRGRFIEDDNFHTRATAAAPSVDFMGTNLVSDAPGAESWRDYELRVRLRSTDDDGIGVLLRALDDDNFYRVVFCNEATADWRAPQGISVQRCRRGAWRQLYHGGGPSPNFIYEPNRPFDLTARVETNPQGAAVIQLSVIDDPGGAAHAISLPPIVDEQDPIPSGSVGLFQWGNDASIFSSFGGAPAPLATDLSGAVLLPDPFVAGYGAWTSTYTEGQTAGGPPLWGIRLFDEQELIENSDGRQRAGAGVDCGYEPYLLVAPVNNLPARYTIRARLASTDDDGLGLVLGYVDAQNYHAVAFRRQAGDLGFPQGVSLRQVIDGQPECLPSKLPPRGGLAGIWMQKLQTGAIEMSDDAGLDDGSGQAGVEFQGPRLVRGNVDWTDYTYEAVIEARDDDGLGLLYRYQDERNFYRLTFQDEAHDSSGSQQAPLPGVSVHRVADGIWTEIFRDTRPTSAGGFKYDADGRGAPQSEGHRIWRVRLTCTGTEFDLAMDGIDDRNGAVQPNVYQATFTDDSPHALRSGKVGLHTWRHNANEFRELRLTLAGQRAPEFEIGFGDPDPFGWEDVTDPALRDPMRFTAINYADPNGPGSPSPFAGVECGRAACAAGGHAGAGRSYSGIGLRPELQALGVRDNRWISGTRFVRPDDPFTPQRDPDLTRGTVDFDGPRAVAGDVNWTNYTLRAVLKAVDDDGLGLLFRYQDEDNFYRLMFMSQAENPWGGPPRGVSVQKRRDGVYEEIFHTDAFVYTPGERWQVELAALAEHFTLRIIQLDGDVDRDGEALYSFAWTDLRDPLRTGRIGVTAWGAKGEVDEQNALLGGAGLDWTRHFDEGAVFDDIRVTEVYWPADMNCDGCVDSADVDPFVLALARPAAYRQNWPACSIWNADCNNDGLINDEDVDAFVRFLNEPRDFALAVLPDTQVYAERYPAIFDAQTQWIAEHAAERRIAFVLHEGDITNRNTLDQWANAQHSMYLLDGRVPYAMAPGNHDYGDGGSANNRDTYFNDYFPLSRYENLPTFGGAFEAGRLDSSYHLFTAGQRDWIILALEWGPRDEVVQWADRILTQHSDRTAIIVTHAYLYFDSTRYNHVTRPDQHWNPHSYGTASLPGGTNDGQELWDKLVSKHANVLLVLNGHVLGDGAGRLSSVGAHGQVVHQMLANYQMRAEGGEGYLRLLEFQPDGRTLRVRTFSPYWNRYMTGPEQEFVLEIPAAGR